MARKKELTVEVWARKMERQQEFARAIGAENFVRLHEQGMALRRTEDFVYDFVDVLYEMQVAQRWVSHGMQVYDFDADFAQSILDEKWIDLLPDCIGNRPHDCFYMKLPCGKLNEGTVVMVTPTEDILGFDPSLFPGLEDGKGVYIGGDPASSDGERGRAVVNTGSETLALCSFAISKTYGLMLDDTPLERYPTELVANGVAYLCSLNADIMPSYKPQPGLKRNNAKRRSNATWYDVGTRVGSELRAYERAKSERKPHQGGTVRPHMRRAHWHHFWTGPRNGARNLILKWLPPTIVGAGNIDNATLHRVR